MRALVFDHHGVDGYRDPSLIRAPSAVRRRSTVAPSPFRRPARAAVSRHIVPRSGMRRSAHWRAIAPVPVSAGSGQEPCPGVWWISGRAAVRAASSGGNVPYGGPAVWTSGRAVTGTARLPGKVTSTGPRMAVSRSRRVRPPVTVTARRPGGGARHEGGRHAVPPAPEAVNGGGAGPRRPGIPCLPPPPPGRPVHADRRPVLREIPPAPRGNVLHRGDGIAVRPRRNAPAPLRPRPDAVFSGVFLTVPSGMEPAVSSPPGRSAGARTVQWLRPSGGRARAMATGPASAAPPGPRGFPFTWRRRPDALPGAAAHPPGGRRADPRARRGAGIRAAPVVPFPAARQRDPRVPAPVRRRPAARRRPRFRPLPLRKADPMDPAPPAGGPRFPCHCPLRSDGRAGAVWRRVRMARRLPDGDRHGVTGRPGGTVTSTLVLH